MYRQIAIWASTGVVAALGGYLVWQASALSPPPATAATQQRVIAAKVVRVIDGDTFVLADGRRVRVKDFDAPELRRARCPAERAAAIEAQRAAAALLVDEPVRLEIDGRDRYRRLVASVRLGADASADFRSEMVSRGHGAFWAYGRERKPQWC